MREVVAQSLLQVLRLLEVRLGEACGTRRHQRHRRRTDAEAEDGAPVGLGDAGLEVRVLNPLGPRRGLRVEDHVDVLRARVRRLVACVGHHEGHLWAVVNIL